MSYRRDVEDRMENPNLLRDMGINQSRPTPAAIDFESDEPLVCDPNRPDAETCEACQ